MYPACKIFGARYKNGLQTFFKIKNCYEMIMSGRGGSE